MNEAIEEAEYRLEYAKPDGGCKVLWARVDVDPLSTVAEAFAALDRRSSSTCLPRDRYRVVQGQKVVARPTAVIMVHDHTGLFSGQKATKGLPTTDAERKQHPVFRGPLMYFPDAFLALAHVCKVGNDQHNPGEPLHWAREKSTEQMDTALRHMMDHGLGNARDTDGTWHLAKAVWRLLAELQLSIEREGGR